VNETLRLYNALLFCGCLRFPPIVLLTVCEQRRISVWVKLIKVEWFESPNLFWICFFIYFSEWRNREEAVTATALSKPFETKPSTLALSLSLYIYICNDDIIIKMPCDSTRRNDCLCSVSYVSSSNATVAHISIIVSRQSSEWTTSRSTTWSRGNQETSKETCVYYPFLPVMQEASMMKP
jgi:hypothetical protein